MWHLLERASHAEIPTFAAGDRVQQRTFLAATGFLFAVTATVSFMECARMDAMAGMAMPGDWTLSMMWMRMYGQTWFDLAASFLSMWVLMMVAMMLPSLVPMLLRYRHSVTAGSMWSLEWLTMVAGAAYFSVWTLFGAAIFLFGILVAIPVMEFSALARAVPTVAGFLLIFAGALQLTPWKAHHLACCRKPMTAGHPLPADFRTAWRHGLQMGLRCCYCCTAFTAVLLVLGVMNPFVMVAVTAAISAERLAPAGERIAQIMGFVIVAMGLFRVVQSVN